MLSGRASTLIRIYQKEGYTTPMRGRIACRGPQVQLGSSDCSGVGLLFFSHTQESLQGGSRGVPVLVPVRAHRVPSVVRGSFVVKFFSHVGTRFFTFLSMYVCI